MPIPIPPSSRSAALLAALSLALLGLGCQQDRVAHFRVPKESPAGPQPLLPGAPPRPMGERTGEASAPAPKAALKWSLPKGWTEAPGTGMRFATFKAPYAGRLEGTASVLPGPAGGELPNVNRWRGQIGLPPTDEAGLAKSRTVLQTKAGAMNVYDFTGEGADKSRMVVGSMSTPDGNTWFLKLTGEAGLVAKAKPEFMNLLGSVHLD